MGGWLCGARLSTETMPQTLAALLRPQELKCSAHGAGLRLTSLHAGCDQVLVQVTRERVRQVEIRAFRKLKNAPKHGTLIEDAVNASFHSKFV